MHALKKWPRLYTEPDLAAGQTLSLPDGQAHYLRNVLRMAAGDSVRLFNGRHGEWAAVVVAADKKGVALRCETLLREQPRAGPAVHLLFAPIKKARLDFLVEKAVELGATHLHPVFTQNTENRTLNQERLRAQIMEAAEQCERMDMPRLFPPVPLEDGLRKWPHDTGMLACIERDGAAPIGQALRTGQNEEGYAVLTGPEGGFTAEERQKLAAHPFVRTVSLGPLVLRSETAVCAALAAIGQHLAG